MKTFAYSLILALSSICSTAHAAGHKYDSLLSGFNYPFPVKQYSFTAQKQKLIMAYMDVPSLSPSAPAIVLLHGKNFSGAYFEKVALFLQKRGFRVIIPDQIGFGKSTKPEHFQYSFQALATYTFQLLNSLGVKKFILLGHSMGGMLATRMALMEPSRIQKLILEDPLGLEDWRTLTPYRSVDELYAMELQSSPESIKAYQLENYYGGVWRPEYQPLVDMLVGWQNGPDFKLIAWNNALTSEMIFTQPVYYEFKHLQMPVILIVGQNDRTAIGKAWATPENRRKMGNYPEMAKDVISKISNGNLIELKNLGHVPHLEDFEAFVTALSKNL